MALGIAVGAALLVLCELKAARRYPITANALDAAGVAILFATFFASHARWRLVPLPAAFALMGLVTLVAVLLSIRRDSLFIALLGLVGGFATPALLSAGEDRPVALFGYLLLLNAGLAWVAYRKRWAALSVLSFLFTLFYQWSWALRFLTTSKVPLAIGIFLTFPVVLLLLSSLAPGAREARERKDLIFSRTLAASAASPLVFFLYMAGVPAYGTRYVLLFGTLLIVTAALAALAVVRGPDLLHVAGGAVSVLVFLFWMSASYRSAAWPGILLFVSAFILLFLGASVVARRAGRPFSERGELGTLAAPALLFAFPVLIAIEPAAAAPGLTFSLLFLLMALLSAFAVFYGRGAIHFIAAFFALAAEAVWSARHLTAARLLPALTIYAVFALFYLGVPLLAKRIHKTLRPEGSGALLLFASIALLFFLAAGPIAQATLWGIALLLAVLNVGLFFEGAAGRHPALSVAGILLSWIVLLVWWRTATVSAMLFPALLVVAGFAALVLAGNIWAQRRASGDPTVFSSGLYLSLVGHLFLLFVVTQASLSVPPWPFLAVLALLDLALAAAALYTGKWEIHIAALAGSQVILAVWLLSVPADPWPTVALLSSAALALFGGLWIFLARLLEARGRLAGSEPFAAAGAAGLLLLQAVAILSSQVEGAPEFGLLVAAQAGAVAGLLAIGWMTRWHVLALLAIPASAAAVFLWRTAHFRPELWGSELLFAGVIYLAFVAYPPLLGARAGRFREPHLAAILAGVPFFFLARHALLAGGWENRIGVLPLSQAALMALLLWRLLRWEPPSERFTARLAIVAGTALAFLTLSIPLQLDKEWITIAFALEAAALAWLYGKVTHRGLLLWTAGLAATVFVRLVLNRAVLTYHPRQGIPVWNWYLYTYLVSAAALFLAARFLRKTNDALGPNLPRVSALLPGAATILLFLLVNIEIADYYSKGPNLAFNFSATLAQDLTYTLGWAIFGIALLVAGIVSRKRVARLSALLLLVVTILKCFIHDLWRLGGLYRIGSFVGLAVCLTLVAVALQRFVLTGESRGK
jgi:uncharacterized membrane protein